MRPFSVFSKTNLIVNSMQIHTGGGSRTAATSKRELFVIIVNGFQSLTIITKSSTVDVAAVLDPYLHTEIAAQGCFQE